MCEGGRRWRCVRGEEMEERVCEEGDRGDGGVCVCVRVGGDEGVCEDGRR